MAQEPSFGKSYGWSLGATYSLSKSHCGITFENTWRVPGWWVFVDCNDRSRRHFEFQASDRRTSQWSNKSTVLVTREYLNHEIKGSFTTTRKIFQAWYIWLKMLGTYPTHCQWVMVLLEERVPAVFARTPKMGRQKKKLQDWGYCCCISEQCFKKPLANGKNNWCATTHRRMIREWEFKAWIGTTHWQDSVDNGEWWSSIPHQKSHVLR